VLLGFLLLGRPFFLFPAPLAALCLAALCCAGLYVGWCLWPRARLFIEKDLIASLPAYPDQSVRLTIDDGPTPGLTERILDLLHAAGVRASFFVLLKKARQNPRLIRRIVEEGHVLGLHGEDHRAPFFRSAAELAESLSRARAELEHIAGAPVVLYRPSHGWKNRALVLAVRQAGLRLCFWDFGVWDTDAPPLPILKARLAAVTPAVHEKTPPPIVLVHDGRGDDPAVPQHGAVLYAALAGWLPELAPSRRET
jgi:peptidoglycan/xylan/chitin deacetylase (PgdA/CDA1 family)